MAWAVPGYSKTRIDMAGQLLASGATDPFEEAQALQILNNWRASHSFPLNTFQVTLRRRARDVYPHALVAQRLKRVPSMIFKLQRIPGMSLSRMQDIGGCRAVVNTVGQVRALHGFYTTGSDLKHHLSNKKDYIQEPKPSGYRGIHLIFKYYSDKSVAYNGLSIEMQLRSHVQHAWATAVETVGTFLDQSLKSSLGSQSWLQFFAVTSSAFALLEGTPLVPGTPFKERDIRAAVKDMTQSLDVELVLSGYGAALQIIEEGSEKGDYFLLTLRPQQRSLTVRGYQRNELPVATEQYLEAEKAFRGQPGAQVVLVAADSLDALRRAYPNYYLDTNRFIEYLGKVR